MSRSRHAAVLYAALGAVHVAAAALHGRRLTALTKPRLLPALALYTAAAHRELGRRVSRRQLLTLVLACAGGVALRDPTAAGQITGMLFFLVAYAIYTAEFVRSGGAGGIARLRRWPWCLVPIGYGTTSTATMAWLW